MTYRMIPAAMLVLAMTGCANDGTDAKLAREKWLALEQARPAIPRDTLPPEFSEVRIVDDQHVFLRAPGIELRWIKDGVEFEDRMVINEQGHIIPATNTRPADEITLAVGEGCEIYGANQWRGLTLLRIEQGRAIFHHHYSNNRMDSVIDEVISVGPYRKP